MQETGLLPRAAKATKQGEHPRGSLQGWVGRFLVYTPLINELAGGTALAGIGFVNTERRLLTQRTVLARRQLGGSHH